jgi:glyoxylase-like metal-dependent hydrolase (beta-lactamase superfamily II)
MAIEPVRDGLWCIDLGFGGEPEVIAAYLIADGDEFALIETGPTSTVDALEAGVRAAGVEPQQISTVVVTHIHLDHAGAAGTLVDRYPNMHIYVHEVGAPHMEDPAKLIASARRIYGDRMDELWGPVVPVPADRLTAVRDGDRLSVGGAVLDILYTPGHASHHVAIVDNARREAFSGDVAAIRLPGFEHVRPATPPPDIELALWNDSLHRLAALHLNRIHLTHFGSFDDVAGHLEHTEAQLAAWAEFIETLSARGASLDELKSALQDRGENEVMSDAGSREAVRRYDLAAPTGMSVDGLLRYFRKRAT